MLVDCAAFVVSLLERDYCRIIFLKEKKIHIFFIIILIHSFQFSFSITRAGAGRMIYNIKINASPETMMTYKTDRVTEIREVL